MTVADYLFFQIQGHCQLYKNPLKTRADMAKNIFQALEYVSSCTGDTCCVTLSKQGAIMETD